MLSIIAPLAAFMVGSAAALGQATVVSKCEYDVYLFAVPGCTTCGYDEVDKTLSFNESFTQQWTYLNDDCGWSIKLSKDKDLSSSNLMQYEYTYLQDPTIWYDLSEVNGNPWDGNWEITSDSADCVPKDTAYRYATDDAYGMQSCPADASITVTLCSGESQDDSGAAAASSSAAALSSAASTSVSSAASSSAAPPPSYAETSSSSSSEAAAPSSYAASTTSEAPVATSTSSVESSSSYVAPASSAAPSTTVVATPTTFATSTTATITSSGNVVTSVETDVVYATAYTTLWEHHGHHTWARHRRNAHNHA